MKVNDMTDNLFELEMSKLLSQVQFWAMRLDNINLKFKLEPTPVSCEDEEYPFPLALKLKRLWDYARGTGPRPREMEQIIQDLCNLLWAPIAATGCDVPAIWWETPLGTMVRMCQARAKLDAGKELTVDELAVLSNVGDKRVRQLCQDGTIKAEKVATRKQGRQQWSISAEEAKKFLLNG